jgi:phosphoribosyl 1,2-cyclic phosphodiesterase
MTFFQTLYSGSSGNSTLICDRNNKVLVDIGMNYKTTVSALDSTGTMPEEISALVITHEHIDHVAGLRVFLKKHKIPVYASKGTLNYLLDKDLIPEHTDTIPLKSGETVALEGMEFFGFNTSHDSAECFGYRFSLSNSKSISILTDSGCVSCEIMDILRASNFIAIESNYDENMLRYGDYPYFLKRRIFSDKGHLSNTECSRIVAELACESGDKKFCLMHLSKNNNAPEIARMACLSALENFGVECSGLEVAPRSRPGAVVKL